MKRRWIAAAIPLALAAAPSATARTWHILNDGSGDAPTVQAGIDSAVVGDTVLVGPGTYLENLSIQGKDLVLQSELGSEVTILDGSNQQETVIHLDALTRSTVVEGFSITGGRGHLRGSGRDGGGLFLGAASATIRNNRILSNSARYGGGAAVANAQACPLFEENLFSDNQADLGAGLVLGPSIIRSNIFRNNDCQLDGGAIYAVFNSGFLTIEDNQFWNNSAGDHGGAVAVAGSTNSEIFLVRNLFVRNDAAGSARDGAAGAAIWVVSLPGVIANNTLVENIGPDWSTCGGGGLSLQSTPINLDVYANLIALNQSCGLICASSFPAPQNTLGENLLWMNAGGDLGQDQGACPESWAGTQLIADPLFCDPAAGNYTVSIESPALTGSMPFGVWTTPGCGPGVSARPTTWGRLKALYR